MNAPRAKSFARQIGLFSLLTAVVAVLTLLFSLAGTLFVAVLGGMMAGAFRRWHWQLIFISLVCPIVVLAPREITQVGLEGQQRFALAAVCLGIFWATYLVTRLVMGMEKASEPAARRSSARRESGTSICAQGATEKSLTADAALVAVKPAAELSLDHLQGIWRCESGQPDQALPNRILAIAQDKFSLSIANAGGPPQLLARGEVLVRSAASAKGLVFSADPPATACPSG